MEAGGSVVARSGCIKCGMIFVRRCVESGANVLAGGVSCVIIRDTVTRWVKKIYFSSWV